MVSSYTARIVKAVVRRIIWKFDSVLRYFNLSLILFDIPAVRGLSLSKRTPSIEIEALLNKLRPVNNGHDLIRVGDPQDGGYLLPNDLLGVTRCLSAGCDLNWTFEKSLFSVFGISSSILDSEEKKPKDLGEEQSYVPKWLGRQNSSTSITFENWIATSTKESLSDLVLQMDIEGFEWEALANIDIDQLVRFRIMSIEFHLVQNLYNYRLFQRVYSPVILTLLEHFDVIHIHPNNCCGLIDFGNLKFPNIFELTLHRKDRSVGKFGFSNLPHTLDVRNVPSKAELRIGWIE